MSRYKVGSFIQRIPALKPQYLRILSNVETHPCIETTIFILHCALARIDRNQWEWVTCIHLRRYNGSAPAPSPGSGGRPPAFRTSGHRHLKRGLTSRGRRHLSQRYQQPRTKTMMAPSPPCQSRSSSQRYRVSGSIVCFSCHNITLL